MSEKEDIPKEERFASPGMPSVPFPHVLLILKAQQSAPAAKADIPQGSPSVLRYSKVVAGARKPLAAANAGANADADAKPNPKKSRAASKLSKLSGRRVQFMLSQATKEQEDRRPILPDSSKCSCVLRSENSSKEQKKK